MQPKSNWQAVKQFGYKLGLDLWQLLKSVPLAIVDGVKYFVLNVQKLGYEFLTLLIMIAVGVVLASIGNEVKAVLHDTYVVGDEAQTITNDIIGVLATLAHDVQKVDHFFGGHKHFGLNKVEFMGPLMPYKDRHEICDAFTSVTNEVLFIPIMMTNTHVCPIVRYFWGTSLEWLMRLLFFWGYEDADPKYGNCRLSTNDYVCFGIEFGEFMILRFLVPLAVFFWFLWPLLLHRIVVRVLVLAELLVSTVVHAIRWFFWRELFPVRASNFDTSVMQHLLGHVRAELHENSRRRSG